MKKLLSVLLAVMMLFSVVVLTASANSANYVNTIQKAESVMNAKTENSDKEHVVAFFDCGVFTTKSTVKLFNVDTNKFEKVASGYSGSFFIIPEDSSQLYIGGKVSLPTMNSTETYQFLGWYCEGDNNSYVAGKNIEITPDMVEDGLISFVAEYEPASPPEDTMGTIVDILCKIFGAIIGLLIYNGDTAAGVQMMQGILGGVLG